jgi:hypothetical protein
MTRQDFVCEECDGNGEDECCECGTMITCEECDGTGFDPDKIDHVAFRNAVSKLGKGRKRLLDAKGNELGTQSADEKSIVLYASFARKGHPNVDKKATFNEGFAAAGRALCDDPSPENPYTEGTEAHQGFEAYLATVLEKRT